MRDLIRRQVSRRAERPPMAAASQKKSLHAWVSTQSANHRYR